MSRGRFRSRSRSRLPLDPDLPCSVWGNARQLAPLPVFKLDPQSVPHRVPGLDARDDRAVEDIGDFEALASDNDGDGTLVGPAF
jgi:hypothetical protein